MTPFITGARIAGRIIQHDSRPVRVFVSGRRGWNEMRSARVKERVLWLLRLLKSHGGFIVAWDSYTVDNFVRDFPEAEKSLRFYLIGPNSCPMLNDAAKRAKRAGFIKAGHIGNEDARAYSQRTWCRTWSLTALGYQELDRSQAQAEAR